MFDILSRVNLDFIYLIMILISDYAVNILSKFCRMNENMEFPGATEADINWLQDCFVQHLKDKVLVDSKIID